MKKQEQSSPNERLPENIRQMIDLVSAVIHRIDEKRLDNTPVKSLCMSSLKGGSAT